jgi:hypothetical protein
VRERECLLVRNRLLLLKIGDSGRALVLVSVRERECLLVRNPLLHLKIGESGQVHHHTHL